MKKDENGSFLYKNFSIDCNFKSFNDKANKLVDSLFDFNVVNMKEDELVSNPIIYIEHEDNMYSSASQEVQMLNDGMILGVFEDNDYYSILIEYKNGVLASYQMLENVNVKQYDQLKKGDCFAYYNESFKVLFKKDGKLINYNEAL